MSLLDAARRLAVGRPYDAYGGNHCVFCAGRDEVEGHYPHCPWLAMPKIINVIEIAERIARRYGHEYVEDLASDIEALVAALKDSEPFHGA